MAETQHPSRADAMESPPPPPASTPTESSFGIDDDATSSASTSASSTAAVAPPPSVAPAPAPSQQQGDLATANRLLRSCRTLIDQLNKQLAAEKEETAKVRDEFQKYRVRVELARKNSELEITNLSEVNLKFKQYNVVSHDVQHELDVLRRRYEVLERERTDAMADVQKLTRQLAMEKHARKRAEDEVEDWKAKAENIGPEALAKAKADLTEELGEIRKEFRTFRERTLKQLEEKDAEIVRARMSSEASTELAYLRDVILKYLASTNDPVSKQAMEAAIATVLRFNQQEVEFVKEKRRTDAGGWKVSLSSLGIN